MSAANQLSRKTLKRKWRIYSRWKVSGLWTMGKIVTSFCAVWRRTEKTKTEGKKSLFFLSFLPSLQLSLSLTESPVWSRTYICLSSPLKIEMHLIRCKALLLYICYTCRKTKNQKFIFLFTERCSPISLLFITRPHELNGTHAFHLDGSRTNAMDQNLPVSVRALPLTSGKIWKPRGPFEYI